MESVRCQGRQEWDAKSAAEHLIAGHLSFLQETAGDSRLGEREAVRVGPGTWAPGNLVGTRTPAEDPLIVSGEHRLPAPFYHESLVTCIFKIFLLNERVFHFYTVVQFSKVP